MIRAVLSVAATTVYLAGIVALLAAWFPTARAWLRQDKQTGVNWWQNPGLTNMPVYGMAIVGLLLLRLFGGKQRLATALPGAVIMAVIYLVMYTTALSVV